MKPIIEKASLKLRVYLSYFVCTYNQGWYSKYLRTSTFQKSGDVL
jgi:hypothetical protein